MRRMRRDGALTDLTGSGLPLPLRHHQRGSLTHEHRAGHRQTGTQHERPVRAFHPTHTRATVTEPAHRVTADIRVGFGCGDGMEPVPAPALTRHP